MACYLSVDLYRSFGIYGRYHEVWRILASEIEKSGPESRYNRHCLTQEGAVICTSTESYQILAVVICQASVDSSNLIHPEMDAQLLANRESCAYHGNGLRPSVSGLFCWENAIFLCVNALGLIMCCKMNRLFNIVALSAIGMCVALPRVSLGQQAWSYQLVPTTVYDKKPVKVTRWVDETVMERKEVTSAVPTWQTEKRQRTKTTFVPTKETAERLETIVLRKPVVKTLMRDKTTTETTYEKVTRYRDEEYTVLEPVLETQMRTEQVTVRKPEIKRMIEVTSRTTYEPVISSQTELVPAEVPVILPGASPAPNARPRMQWLQSGYYTDPVSGQTVYRRRGLHWVIPNESVPAASVAPALVPQEIGKLSYVPKTVEERKPIEITRYVDQIETRKVPVQVEKMVERTRTRRVPYEVEIPKTVSTTEQIPYTETTYVDETVTKKVPYERTVLKKVETTEEYEVEVPKWITKTSEVEVPTVVRKKYEYEVMQNVPRTIMMKVPVDICGNPLSAPVPVNSTQRVVASSIVEPSIIEPPVESRLSTGYGTTQNRPVQTETSGNGSSVLSDPEVRNYRGQFEVRDKPIDETSARKSVLVPGTTPDANNPGTDLQPLSVYKELAIPAATSDELGASPWRRVEAQTSSPEPAKTLVETVKRVEKEPAAGSEAANGNQKVEDANGKGKAEPSQSNEGDASAETNVPSAAKPETDVEPKSTGDEGAADLPKSKTSELNEGE